MSIEIFNLTKRLEKEEYILGGIKPSSKTYRGQFQKVKDLKIELEFLTEKEKKDNPGN